MYKGRDYLMIELSIVLNFTEGEITIIIFSSSMYKGRYYVMTLSNAHTVINFTEGEITIIIFSSNMYKGRD